jgi:hypothetical protein
MVPLGAGGFAEGRAGFTYFPGAETKAAWHFALQKK